MIKLIRLELKRNNIRTYVVASALSCVAILAFIYFIAYVAQVDTSRKEMQFQNYMDIFRLAGAISILIFSTLSAIMYSRFIIDEYSGKRAALLFSYPVSASKILLAKLLLVIGFTSIAMVICISIPFIIFSVMESISPIVVQDVLTINLVVHVFKTLGASVIAVGATGLIAVRIGFIKKSIPTTLVMSFALAAIIANVTIAALNNSILSMVVIIVSLIVAGMVIVEFMKKIKNMEVE